MRARNVLMFAVSFVLAAAVLAQSAKSAAKAGPVPMPAADLKWTDLDPVALRESRSRIFGATIPRARSASSSSFRRGSRLPFTRTPTI